MRYLDNPILQWELQRIRQSPWRPGRWFSEHLSAFGQMALLAVILGCGLICGFLLADASEYIGLILSFAAAIPAWIAPALTAVAIAGERERGTFDLLRVTLLSEKDIILGKLGACLARLWPGFLVLVLLIPFQFLWGGIDRLSSVLPALPKIGELWWWCLSGAMNVFHSLVNPLLFATIGLSYSVRHLSLSWAILLSYAMTLVFSLAFGFTGTLVAVLLSALVAFPSQVQHVLIASGVLPGALLLIKILCVALWLRVCIRQLERE